MGSLIEDIKQAALDQFKVKVIEHTRVLPSLYNNPPCAAPDMFTLQLTYPRFIHAEAKTHRVITGTDEELVVLTQDEAFMDDQMLSRNASSSRAIPVAKMIEQVRNNPALPVYWGKNRAGMQAKEEVDDIADAMFAWKESAKIAAARAERLAEIGLHKQIVNRVLEPFQLIHVVVTATEWSNFFALRDHEDAQPEIQVLARKMREAMAASTPRLIDKHWTINDTFGWHLPYISDEERALYRLDVLLKCSTARCARTSYMNHDGTSPVVSKDIQLHADLVGSDPLHASPTEHQAHPVHHMGTSFFKNFQGWQQYRHYVETKTEFF